MIYIYDGHHDPSIAGGVDFSFLCRGVLVFGWQFLCFCGFEAVWGCSFI